MSFHLTPGPSFAVVSFPSISRKLPEDTTTTTTISHNISSHLLPEDMTPRGQESWMTCNQSPEAVEVSRTPLVAVCPVAEL